MTTGPVMPGVDGIPFASGPANHPSIKSQRSSDATLNSGAVENSEAAASEINSGSRDVLDLSPRATEIMLASRQQLQPASGGSAAGSAGGFAPELMERFTDRLGEIVARANPSELTAVQSQRVTLDAAFRATASAIAATGASQNADAFIELGTEALDTLEGRGLKILLETMKRFAANAEKMTKNGDAELSGFLTAFRDIAGGIGSAFESINSALDGFFKAGEGGGSFVMVLEANVAAVTASVSRQTGERMVEAANLQLRAMGFSLRIEVTLADAPEEAQADPLVLDLDGNGIQLTTARDGMPFDILGDGVMRMTATVMDGSAFLALDRDGDGLISSGCELFGDQNGAANGFAELAKYDDNRDGVIDAADWVYKFLLLYVEKNNDGIGSGDELRTLASAGIDVIDLSYVTVNRIASGGNVEAERGTYAGPNGRKGTIADYLLNYVV